jgi:hypothetical protein
MNKSQEVLDKLLDKVIDGLIKKDDKMEIKFRAWDKKGRWDGMANVIFIDFNDKYVAVEQGWNEDPETGETDCCADFDEIELMQFTGLQDKDGVDIYDGDIVEDEDGNKHIVRYNIKNACFEPFGNDRYANIPRLTKVVGSIHDDSEEEK